MSSKIYNLIITILLTIIAVMSWKIYELKESSAKLQQFSIQTGADCIENMKTMTNEEIEYCLPVMELLGFKYNPEEESEQNQQLIQDL